MIHAMGLTPDAYIWSKCLIIRLNDDQFVWFVWRGINLTHWAVWACEAYMSQ